METKYGKFNDEKVRFVNDIKNFVTAHEREALKHKVEKNGGKLTFNLNGKPVELNYKEDFFMSAHEMVGQ